MIWSPQAGFSQVDSGTGCSSDHPLRPQWGNSVCLSKQRLHTLGTQLVLSCGSFFGSCASHALSEVLKCRNRGMEITGPDT